MVTFCFCFRSAKHPLWHCMTVTMTRFSCGTARGTQRTARILPMWRGTEWRGHWSRSLWEKTCLGARIHGKLLGLVFTSSFSCVCVCVSCELQWFSKSSPCFCIGKASSFMGCAVQGGSVDGRLDILFGHIWTAWQACIRWRTGQPWSEHGLCHQAGSAPQLDDWQALWRGCLWRRLDEAQRTISAIAGGFWAQPFSLRQSLGEAARKPTLRSDIEHRAARRTQWQWSATSEISLMPWSNAQAEWCANTGSLKGHGAVSHKYLNVNESWRRVCAFQKETLLDSTWYFSWTALLLLECFWNLFKSLE